MMKKKTKKESFESLYGKWYARYYVLHILAAVMYIGAFWMSIIKFDDGYNEKTIFFPILFIIGLYLSSKFGTTTKDVREKTHELVNKRMKK